jgi:hypothetical protein
MLHPHVIIPKTNKLWLIGDLDGNFDNLITHLLSLGVVDSKSSVLKKDTISWIWWDSIIIFSWDILADRNMDGFKILKKIHKLRQEAQEAWWDIIVLAGNHEWFMLQYLRGKILEPFSKENLPKITKWTEYYGMKELLEYGSDPQSILEEMRKTKTGRSILEEICAMKLVVQYNDTIHFHTPPSWAILNLMWYFYKEYKNIPAVIDQINRIWRMSLENIMFGKEFPESEFSKTGKEFFDILNNIFLHTYNGTPEMIKNRQGEIENHIPRVVPKEHRIYTAMIQDGITTLYYGHDSRTLDIKGLITCSVNRLSTWVSANINERIQDILND